MKATAKFGWHLFNPVAFIRLNLFVKIELQNNLTGPLRTRITHRKKAQRGIYFQITPKISLELVEMGKLILIKD